MGRGCSAQGGCSNDATRFAHPNTTTLSATAARPASLRTSNATERVPAASTDEGAECLNGPLDSAFVGVWTLQGCDYARFADLLAIGLTRTGVSSDGPALIDPSVVTVSSMLGGRAVFSEVRFGQPGADGATLHLSAQVRFNEPVDLTTAVDELVVGVLPGWQVLRGDGSVLLSGPTGATWTITPTVAVFEWAGRW